MLFPIRFDPSALQGPRAKQHSNRPDAFQQLVGDALRDEFGFRASVSPTKGRDGAIDAFIDDKAGSEALANLPAPQIIECKDHDDTCGDLKKKINQGWNIVANKLKEQAELGWTGDFEPWIRVKSYVYCISSVLGKQVSREQLQEKITNFFFNELPESLRPPLLEKILVLDWSDLQNTFNRLPRIADRWIGLQLPKIESHAEYCESLTQFRRYLLEENFPFVKPEKENDNACPANILTRLEHLAGIGGILLKGIGGVGKTRTALEVAQLADDKGWRVLHLLPDDPGITVDDLSEALFSGNEKTLLVFDYLDQMPKLDLGSVRHRILHEAATRGMPLALLANLRLSSLRNREPERDALFTEQILLQTSASQKARIKEIALERIAPLAVAQLGHEKVHELCGERPIIAMFIAEELQRRAKEGILEKTDLSVIRNNNLTGWLKKRLFEDKLVVNDNGNSFLPPQPEPWLISAATMLAVAPLARVHMEEAGSKAFLAAGGDNSQMATHVLDQLLTLGWIEQRGIELSASHDVVADEVLNEVLWDCSDQLREAVLDYCLTPALDRARTLGRYATALNRLQGAEKTETKGEAILHEKVGHWLRTHCSELGRMLATTEAGESAYALGNLISTPGWATVCITEWSKLVTPWLNNHSLHPEARHLLYRGMKDLPEVTAQELIIFALDWLPHHRNSDTASYVLAPLLNRREINEQNAVRSIAFAINWIDQFPLIPETEFVLAPLLARGDLGEYSIRAIAFAINWIDQFPLVPETEFVLAPLLARNDLGEHSNRAIAFAINWIDQFPLVPETGFVLAPLLARNDLGEYSIRAIAFAINWIDRFPLVPETQFVLHSLLARNDLGEYSNRAIAFAINWIDQFPLVTETRFVLASLLACNDLGEHSIRAIAFAINWIDQFPLVTETGFVLAPLLDSNDLGDQASRAIAFAINWIDQFPLVTETGFVLKRLLARNDLGDQASRAIAFTINWIEQLPLVTETGFVLKPLLTRNDLGDHASRAIEFAINWIEQFPLVTKTGFVLAPLLARNDLYNASNRAIELALSWVKNFLLNSQASFVFKPLLKRKDLNNHSIQAIDFAIQWLNYFSLDTKASYVLAPLLSRYDLGNYSDQAITFTINWLKKFPKIPEARFVCQSLLNRKDIDPSDRIQLQDSLDTFYKSKNQFINPEIAHELTNAALGRNEKPNNQRLKEIIEIMANAINTSRPIQAAFMLPGLLAIVQPFEDSELWKRIIDLANQILEHPKFLPINKIKLANSIWYLVDKNAWPEELANPVLNELGLNRPQSGKPPEQPAI